MREHIPAIYGIWAALVLLLAAQGLWALFFGFPAGLERMLRRGRQWVYVPLRWKGFRKVRILFLSRLLALGVAASGAALLVHYSERRQTLWIIAFVALCYAVAAWLQELWHGLRYKQQEDAYFLLLDEARARFEAQHKDHTPAQLRSLSAYQHQQSLRKADEEGRLLAAIAAEARRFRRARPAAT
jgi:hypothetical protein